MENKALQTLQIHLGRRGLDTKIETVVSEELERVSMYTVGSVLVIFSQKEKGLVERDIRNFVAFADTNQYTNGVILIGMSKPSLNVMRVVRSFAKDRIQFFWIWHLQNDWTTHRYYMPHRILNEQERTTLFKKYKIVNPAEQLPYIDSQDFPSKILGAMPGDVIEITRHSDVAGRTLHWRYCVEDVNVV